MTTSKRWLSARRRPPTYRLRREIERHLGDWEFGAKDHSDNPNHRYRSIRFGRVHLNKNGSNSIGWLYLHGSRVWYGPNESLSDNEHWRTSTSWSVHLGRLDFHGAFEWRGGNR